MIINLLTWDWKEQLDIEDLAKVIDRLTYGKIKIVEIQTGSDEFAIAIADEPITHDQAKSAYDHRWDGYD